MLFLLWFIPHVRVNRVACIASKNVKRSLHANTHLMKRPKWFMSLTMCYYAACVYVWFARNVLVMAGWYEKWFERISPLFLPLSMTSSHNLNHLVKSESEKFLPLLMDQNEKELDNYFMMVKEGDDKFFVAFIKYLSEIFPWIWTFSLKPPISYPWILFFYLLEN